MRLNDGTCCVSALTYWESKLKISKATCLFNLIHSYVIGVVFFPASLGHVVVFFQHFLNVSCFIWYVYISSCFRSPSCPVAHLCDRPALMCCTCCLPSPGLFKSVSSPPFSATSCSPVWEFQLFSFVLCSFHLPDFGSLIPLPLSCFDWWLTYQPDLRLIQSALWIR